MSRRKKNRVGRNFSVWREGHTFGVTAATDARLARLLFLLTAEPRRVCVSAAQLAWAGRSVHLQQDGDALWLIPEGRP